MEEYGDVVKKETLRDLNLPEAAFHSTDDAIVHLYRVIVKFQKHSRRAYAICALHITHMGEDIDVKCRTNVTKQLHKNTDRCTVMLIQTTKRS